MRYHDLLFKRDERLLKKWLRKFGPEVLYEILEIKRADNLAVGCDVTSLIDMFDDVKLMIDRIIEEGQCYSLKQLQVTGLDVMDACQVKGPEVGRILNLLLDRVIDGEIENKKAPLLEEAMLIKQETGDR